MRLLSDNFLRLYRTRRYLIDVFYWISTIIKPNEIIEVHSSIHGVRYYVFDFPLKIGTYPKRVYNNNNIEVSFKVYLWRKPEQNLTPNYIKIFSSPCVSVYEASFRHAKIRPVRLGLSDDDVSLVGNILREDILAFFEKRESKIDFESIPKRFKKEKIDVGVLLWKGGVLRGSWVISGYAFLENARRACRSALTDTRFLPLSQEDIGSIDIQITILSDLKIPISTQERENDVVYHDKAYCYKGADKQSCIVPAAFNVKLYETLNNVYIDLAKKAFYKGTLKKMSVVTGDVLDYVYCKDNVVLRYYSTMHDDINACEINDEVYKTRAQGAAYSLMRAISLYPEAVTRGNDKLKNSSHTHWARHAFVIYALSSYSAATREVTVQNNAVCLLTRMYTQLFDGRYFVFKRHLALAYLGLAAHTLGEETIVLRIKDSIMRATEQLDSFHNMDTITLSQICAFLSSIHCESSYARRQILKKSLIARYNITIQRKDFCFAEWAEFVLQCTSEEKHLIEGYFEVLLKYQKTDGSFSSSPAKSETNTSESGKIFEVLVKYRGEYPAAFKLLSQYMINMQYIDHEYFLPPLYASNLKGLLRYDYSSLDIRLDGTGHFVLGCSHLVNKYG